MWGYGPYGMGYGGGWVMMIFGGIFWIALLVLVGLAIMWFLRNGGHVGSFASHDQRSGGLDILEERYARGEIERDEYLQKKGDILGREPKA